MWDDVPSVFRFVDAVEENYSQIEMEDTSEQSDEYRNAPASVPLESAQPIDIKAESVDDVLPLPEFIQSVSNALQTDIPQFRADPILSLEKQRQNYLLVKLLYET